MSGQLVKLKPTQLPVTRLPRLLTELPFFYLTKRAKALTEPIDFAAEDAEGRPITWKVSPNFGEKIGPPSLIAHEVWVRLIKPRVDKERASRGFIPSIIPLGGVRECLRALGWSYGGHQAKSLFRAINQIGGAWCEANLWLPTRETESGDATLRAFHASFSRLSLYAIGANHLTEEDVRSGSIDVPFELDDVLYVKLDPMEMRMLEGEIDRPVDNEYLFSLSPAARRWYELMAPKFYGVISNADRSRGYCDIRYSWYVQRHHTLKPHDTRKRMVQQMNEVVEEHLRFGFVHKVDYQSVREGKREPEILIRYYPGRFAVKVTRRIADRLHGREVTKRVLKQSTHALPDDEEKRLERQLTDIGVVTSKARYLVFRHRTSVERQLAALQYRERTGIRDIAAWLIRAIEEDFDLPELTATAMEKHRRADEARARSAVDQAREEHEKRFREEYSNYLWQREEAIKVASPQEYQAFLEATADERSSNERFLPSPEIRKILVEKLFSDFFHNNPVHGVLDFWEWDASLNREPFQQQQ